MTDETRPPIVSDIDRTWALEQCPSWAVRATPADRDWLDEHDPEAPHPRGRSGVLVWDFFVTDQIERFERFFADERKRREEWSALWRKGWWPKADARKLYPGKVPPSGKVFPVYRKGSPEFAAALALATPHQRKVWSHIGEVIFDPADPLVAKIRTRVANAARQETLSARSRAMMGERG